MDIVPFSEIGAGAWNEAVHASDDGWFWHTRQYSEFLLDLGDGRGVQDLSFGLVDQSRIIAVCPLYLDEWQGVHCFGCGGEPVPFPAITRSPVPGQREGALARYCAELGRIAAERNAAYAQVKIPALAPSRIDSPLLPFNPLVRFGFLDLPFATQVVDVTQPNEQLWAGMRKGHKYDIRRAERACEIAVWDRDTVTTEAFRRYQHLHHKDAGRVTRSQHSFDLMLEWIRSGYATLFEAVHQGRPVAFALVTLFGVSAYYGSGCKDPDEERLSPSHLLQWGIMQWLRARGTRFYDLGLQYFGPQWFHAPSGKEIGISRFKRGFGGVTIPVQVAEYFFSMEYRSQVLRQRFDRLVSGPGLVDCIP